MITVEMNVFTGLTKLGRMHEIGYEIVADTPPLLSIGQREPLELGISVIITAQIKATPDELRHIQQQWEEYVEEQAQS